MGRNGFGSQPGRITDDDIKAAFGKYVRKVTLIVKPGDFSVPCQAQPGLPQIPTRLAQRTQPFTELTIQTAAPPEQVARSCLVETFCNGCVVQSLGRSQRVIECSGFHLAESTHQ